MHKFNRKNLMIAILGIIVILLAVLFLINQKTSFFKNSRFVHFSFGPRDTVVLRDTVYLIDFRILKIFSDAREKARDYAINRINYIFDEIEQRITDSFLDSCLKTVSLTEKWKYIIRFHKKELDTLVAIRVIKLFKNNVLKPEVTRFEIQESIDIMLQTYLDFISDSLNWYNAGLLGPPENTRKISNINISNIQIESVTANYQNPTMLYDYARNLDQLVKLKRIIEGEKTTKKQLIKRFFTKAPKKSLKILGREFPRISKIVINFGDPILLFAGIIYDSWKIYQNYENAKKLKKDMIKTKLICELDSMRFDYLHNPEYGILHILDEFENNIIDSLSTLHVLSTQYPVKNY